MWIFEPFWTKENSSAAPPDFFHKGRNPGLNTFLQYCSDSIPPMSFGYLYSSGCFWRMWISWLRRRLLIAPQSIIDTLSPWKLPEDSDLEAWFLASASLSHSPHLHQSQSLSHQSRTSGASPLIASAVYANTILSGIPNTHKETRTQMKHY